MSTKCPFCGHAMNPSHWLDCGKFFTVTCEKCGKGFIMPKTEPKPSDN